MNMVIFDLDGTLIDSIGDIQVAVNHMLNGEGVAPLSDAEVLSFVGNGLPKLVERVIEARKMPPTEFQRLHDIVLDLYTNTPVSLTKPYPGVIDALHMLQSANLKLAVCTNKPHAAAVHVMQALGLHAFFDVVVGGDSLPERKPHALPLLHAASVLGGGDVLFVGDSEVDAETAVNANVKFALFTEGYRKTAVKEIPHRFRFSDYAALGEIVKTAFASAA